MLLWEVRPKCGHIEYHFGSVVCSNLQRNYDDVYPSEPPMSSGSYMVLKHPESREENKT